MPAFPIGIALVGLGKIAREQHVPALAANADFRLLAGASPHSRIDAVPCYPDLDSLLRRVPETAAVALCTTPQVRCAVARRALEHGCDVLLEKPPGMSVSEVEALAALAARQQAVLYTSWHSRHAAAVGTARAWLAGKHLHEVRVHWQEDVRVWHPGQHWIWQPGGLGVFDPGINALSILTLILPHALTVRTALLSYPANCATPIAARLQLADPYDLPVAMELDFLHPGEPRWNIELQTSAGRLLLTRGGRSLAIDGRPVTVEVSEEYPQLYAHFASLVRERRSDVDLSPLRLVAEAFQLERRVEVAPFAP